jgi:deoxycytidine triphosphate deaminase
VREIEREVERMDVLEGEQVARQLKNLINEKMQVHEESVDLTVKSISRVAATGSIDFGGSEYGAGEKALLSPKKLNPADKYGWWLLATGEFLVEYNEELALPPHHLAILQPHERLIECGVSHNTQVITDPGQKLLALIRVSQADLRVKENARISKLIILRH